MTPPPNKRLQRQAVRNENSHLNIRSARLAAER